ASLSPSLPYTPLFRSALGGGLRCPDGRGLGDRLRRRGRCAHQPRRPHPRRPDHWHRHRPDPPPVGEPPLRPLGTRTPPLGGRDRSEEHTSELQSLTNL